MMLRRRNLVLPILALLAAVAGRELRAGEILELEQAMAAARAGAHEVQAATARTAAGDARLRQARSFRLPQVRLQEIWTRTDSPADAFGLMLNQKRFSLADFSAGDPNDPDTIENALTRLEVELPLYTGGEISGRIRQAELGASASRQTAAWVEDQAAWSAAEAYIQLAQAGERAALLERTLETMDAHVALARAYVDQGLVVRSELLRAEVERARISELLTEVRGHARIGAAQLSFRMGVDGARDWTLEPLPEPEAVSVPLDEWLVGADGRFDLEAARQQLEASRLEESIRRSGMWPKVGLLARYDRFDESLFGSSGDSTAIIASASIDLFTGGRHRAAAAVARFETEAGERDVDRFRQGVRLEVRDAYETAVTARQRRATAAAALVAAREAERITRERFANGIAKTLDVLDALTARREAEVRELVARSDAHLASIRLAVTAGRRPESALWSSPVDRNP